MVRLSAPLVPSLRLTFQQVLINDKKFAWYYSRKPLLPITDEKTAYQRVVYQRSPDFYL